MGKRIVIIGLLIAALSACEKGKTEATLIYNIRVENPGDYTAAMLNFEYMRAHISDEGGGAVRSVNLEEQELNYRFDEGQNEQRLGSALIEEATVTGFDLRFDDGLLLRGEDSIPWLEPIEQVDRIETLFNISDEQSRELTFVLDLSASDSVVNGQHYFYPKVSLEIE